MSLLHKLRFLGPLPTLNRLGYGPVPRVAAPRSADRQEAAQGEQPEAAERDWHDPEVPLDDLRAELARRGTEVNVHWNRATLLKHLEGEEEG